MQTSAILATDSRHKKKSWNGPQAALALGATQMQLQQPQQVVGLKQAKDGQLLRCSESEKSNENTNI
jgi:hypothetical protein